MVKRPSAALDFGWASASAAGLPVGEAGKVASSGYKLYEKARENRSTNPVEDGKALAAIRTRVLEVWAIKARGDWVVQADVQAADHCLEKSLAACVPSPWTMGTLAGGDGIARNATTHILVQLAMAAE